MDTQTLDTRALNLTAPMDGRPFRTAAVLGAGTMGAQIAAHLANAGLQVDLLDIAANEETSEDGTPDGGNANAVVQKGFRQAQKAKPAAFFTDGAEERVRLGNFDDDFDRIAGVDWIIEAVVERMDVKREVAARIEEAAGEGAVISTNTSGLPIHEITAGRGEGFRRRFLGTHFFNPPRYLKLLEIIPTQATDPAVVQRVAQFGRLHLGKGIVIANDVPYFIGNRVGVYAQLQALRYFTDGEYTIEEIDTLTGPLVGHPNSATFRTADLVGLDVLRDVTNNLYEKATHDESREAFRVPELLSRLVDEGALGAKAGAGFYKKEDGEIKSINPETGAYVSAQPPDLGDLKRIEQAGGVQERVRMLYEDAGRAGVFFRETTLDLLAYASRRIPETTDSPADVDRAIRWGFGWELGPFELWDAIGFETVLSGMEQEGIEAADWVSEMRRGGREQFYEGMHEERTVFNPAESGYVSDTRPADEIVPAAVSTIGRNVLWENEDAALLDLGDGVALYAFRSKGSTMGQNVIEGLFETLDRVEGDRSLRGVVIGNDSKNFSLGANLGEVAAALQDGQFDVLEQYVSRFQHMVQRVRYAEKPVVVGAHQRVLGGGCEMLMACPHPVAAAESYIGLVELGVGLIPAGTGATRMAQRAAEQAAGKHPSAVQAQLSIYFEQIAMAKVSTSAREAQSMGYLAAHAPVVMNEDRRLFVAKQEVLRLSEQGYTPPPISTQIPVLGRPTRAAFEVSLQQYLEGGFISTYDKKLATALAFVLTGGELTAPQDVHEEYLIDLEREAILQLLGEKKTQERIEHMLKTRKPLRN